MPRREAYRRRECVDCADVIEEGDPIYFGDDGAICEDCGKRDGLVCGCGSQKKPEFKTCYDCHVKV
jgi:hypothetical protein